MEDDLVVVEASHYCAGASIDACTNPPICAILSKRCNPMIIMDRHAGGGNCDRTPQAKLQALARVVLDRYRGLSPDVRDCWHTSGPRIVQKLSPVL